MSLSAKHQEAYMPLKRKTGFVILIAAIAQWPQRFIRQW